MRKRSGAGSLSERVTFQKREEVDDGYGNSVSGDWQDIFTEPARMQPQFGSRLTVEGVTAARLAAMQPYFLKVRSSLRTRAITAAWRVYDARAGMDAQGNPNRSFNIKTIVNPDERNGTLEMLVVEGEAS